MFDKLKANILFNRLLKRPDISKAYKMVDESDSWYDTISTVHKSLAEIQKLPHEILDIKSDDNLTLKGIYYSNNSNTTVIFAHGYTSHAEREWAFPGLFYLSLGYNVLIPYQRAHGLSEGKYISFGAKEHLDMAGWVSKINNITPNGNIIVHGLSMGGGIVLNLSKLKLDNVKCLIADAPSDSINNFFDGVSKHVFKSNFNKIALYAKKRFNKEFNVNINDFEVIEVVKDSKYPILLSAGAFEECQNLFDIIKANNPNETDIIILPGCNHGNGMYKQTNMYQSKIKEFINRYI